MKHFLVEIVMINIVYFRFEVLGGGNTLIIGVKLFLVVSNNLFIYSAVPIVIIFIHSFKFK